MVHRKVLTAALVLGCGLAAPAAVARAGAEERPGREPDRAARDAWSASRVADALAPRAGARPPLARPTPPAAADLGEVASDVELLSISTCGSGFDSQIALWAEDGSLLRTDDNGCITFDGGSLIGGLALPPGRYYFSVSGYFTSFASGFVADVSATSVAGPYSGSVGDTPFGGTVAAGEAHFYTFTVGEGDPPPPPPAIDLGEVAGTLDVFAIDTCASDFDTELTLWAADGTLLDTNDQYCGSGSRLDVFNLPVGRYYFAVTGYDSYFGDHFAVLPGVRAGTYAGQINGIPYAGSLDEGEVAFYTFTVGEGGGCFYECPAGATPEGEPACFNGYADAFNGGCGGDTPAFGSIASGETVCGTAGTFVSQGGSVASRDMDWYAFTLTEYAWVTLSAGAGFQYQAGILDITDGCYNLSEVAVLRGLPCETLTTGPVFLAPGEYTAVMTPQNFEGVPCGTPYSMSLEIDPIEIEPLGEASIGAFTLGETVHGDNSGSDNDYRLWELVPVGDTWLGPDDVWTYNHPGGPLVLFAGPDGDATTDPSIALFDADEQLVAYDGSYGNTDELKFIGGLPAGTYYVVVDSWHIGETGPYVLTASAPLISDIACGTTEGEPTWHRPETWSFDYLSWESDNVPYAAVRFRVSETGTYDLLASYEPGFDGILFLYGDTFDPAEPAAGAIAAEWNTYIPDDPSLIEGVELEAGAVYTAVITGTLDEDFGAYCLIAAGPGEAAETPACTADHDGDGESTVNDLLAYLGDFRNAAPAADIDGQPGITVNDLLAFLGAFRAGC